MFEIFNESAGQQEKFRIAANKLLNQCFLVRKKEDTKKEYIFVRENREEFRAYFEMLGYSLLVNEDQGVIGIKNEYGTGRLSLGKYESIQLLILRLLYLEKRHDISSSYEEIVIYMSDIRERYQMLGLKRKPVMDKSMERGMVSLFKRYNLITNLDNDVTLGECRILIYPSILMAVSIEDIDKYYEKSKEKLSQYASGNPDGDEESPVIKKWYVQECRLEDLSFLIGSRPALADEFKCKGRRLQYIDTDKAARDRFRRRMGNLEPKFFDIIPKSLAFKPMDNVKDFINKFVLADEKVDIQKLRDNIETLSEFEVVLEKTRKKLEALNDIIACCDKVEAKQREIDVNGLLLDIAGLNALRESISGIKKDINLNTQAKEDAGERIKHLETEERQLGDQIQAVSIELGTSEEGKLLDSVKRRYDELEAKRKDIEENHEKYNEYIENIRAFERLLRAVGKSMINEADYRRLAENAPKEEKAELFLRVEAYLEDDYNKLVNICSKLSFERDEIEEERNKAEQRLIRLLKHQLDFPKYATALKSEIEKEFKKRGIKSRVYVLAELLEIKDERWRDAIEGYLNTQKFYLVCEPEYYDIALEVYNRNKKRIHSAGLINTKRIPLETEDDYKSLAHVVKTENRFALAYARYVLGRVVRCDNVSELENYEIAITPECMLYQGYVVRHLSPNTYKDPYIGMNAYRTQIENTKETIRGLIDKRKELDDKLIGYRDVIDRGKVVSRELKLCCVYSGMGYELLEVKKEIEKTSDEIKRLSNNPTLIELREHLGQLEKDKERCINERRALEKEYQRLIVVIEQEEKSLKEEEFKEKEKSKELEKSRDEKAAIYTEALDKYTQNRKTKTADTIFTNFSPRMTQLENERDRLINGERGLIQKQLAFNQYFSEDYITGTEQMSDYREAAIKISGFEVVRYEEKVREAKSECEQIFRSDFLAKMKEHIENAKREFDSLNRALKNVYYGEDSYHFKIEPNGKKEGLYRMIMSENNMAAYGEINLWTDSFEKQYRDEMDDLFDKLMTRDDKGEKVVEEYTDYRSYLDYDIEIIKSDGRRQRFSEIYGEKSGSETQVPYYVAIAASFYQLYRYGDTVRVMLLDEAFDKMDDDRIVSMMKFLKGLELQVIMATPPGKIEVIGEHVDTILTAIRIGQGSIVEEYEL